MKRHLTSAILAAMLSGFGGNLGAGPAQASSRETILYTFQGTPDANAPNAGLIVDAQDSLYGTTMYGGSSGYGSVFKLTRLGNKYSEGILYSFTGSPDGVYPMSPLAADSAGALYGTTYAGGTVNAGTVFKLTPSGSGYIEKIIYNFTGHPDGQDPTAGVIVDKRGNVYGTTVFGGSYLDGIVFKLTPSGSGYIETILYEFTGTPDGANPHAALIFGKGGSLYGTTVNGGFNGAGTVFRLSRARSGYVEDSICLFQGSGNGANPYASVLYGHDGALYGTTSAGGNAGKGIAFVLLPFGRQYKEIVLHSFGNGTDGANPITGLTFGKNAELYGTTDFGGAYGNGTVFILKPHDSHGERVIYDFQGYPNDGGNPYATLVTDQDHLLFGTTSNGGPSNYGTVFSVTP